VSIRTRALTKALDRLNPEERSALYLSAAEGYTAQEIADLFGKPRGTILSMMFRAKKKLQRLLKLNAGGE
jgi:RNA polymerase sigma-70 factor (ECF subfamily)